MKSRLRQPLCLCLLTNFSFYFLFACLYTYTKLLFFSQGIFWPVFISSFPNSSNCQSESHVCRRRYPMGSPMIENAGNWTERKDTKLSFYKATQWALTTEQIPEIPVGIQMEHEFSGARKHLKRPVSPICSKPFLVSVSSIRGRLS